MHLSFEVSFDLVGSEWLCNIVPSWYYSFNGYKKSNYHKDLLSKQKRLEFNQTVRNIVRFVGFYLKELPVSDEQAEYGPIIELTCEDELVDGEPLTSSEVVEEEIS